MELGIADKLHQMVDTIHKLSELLLTKNEASSNSGRFRIYQKKIWEHSEGGLPLF